MKKSFMKRSHTRILALALAAGLLVPSTVPVTTFAADDFKQSNSTGAIENDNSTLPNIKNVVLPAIDNNTYNFRLDVDGLLSQYSSDYVSGKDFYFSSIRTAATVAPTTTGQFLVESSYTVVEDLSSASDILTGTFMTTLATTSLTAIDDTKLANYYIWQPDDTDPGNGKFTKLTADIFQSIFEITVDTTDTDKITAMAIDGGSSLSGAAADVWDGNIYTVAYAAIDGEDAATRYYPNGTLLTRATIDNKTLYVSTDDPAGNVDPANITLADASNATYTAAVTEYTNTSAPQTITNKSSFDIGVTAEVTVTAPGLVFDDDSFSANGPGTTPTANITLNITDGTYKSTVSSDGTAAAYYVIKGTGASAIRYQGAENDTDPETGSRNYYRYVQPNLDYKSASFSLEGDADIDSSDAGRTAAWDAYIDSVEAGTATAPKIDVVYKFVEVKEDAATPGYYIGTDNSTFTVKTADIDFWAEYGAAEGFRKSSYNYTPLNGGTTTTTDEIVTLEFYPDDATFKTLQYTAPGTTTKASMSKGTDFTITGNKITLINKGKLFTAANKLAEDETATYTLTLTVTVATEDGSTETKTFDTNVVLSPYVDPAP